MTNAALLGSFGDVGGGPLVFRNKLINGGMAVDQRNAGATQTFTAAAALAYSVDRWYGYCTGANATGARIAGTGSQFAYRFTGAASVTAIGFAQRIEQLNSYSLAGQTATLSVDLANSLLTTVTWTAYYATTADTFGSLASPTKTSIATGTFTVTSTVTRYQAQITVPAAATTGIEILFTVGAQTSGTWTIQNAQLEAGSLPTPFEQLLYSQTLSLCQRYYIGLYGRTSGTTVFGQGLSESATLGSCSFGFFPTSMRVQPAASIGAGLKLYGTTGVATTNDYSSISINSDRSSLTSGCIYFAFTGAYVGGSFLAYTATTGIQVAFNAEL